MDLLERQLEKLTIQAYEDQKYKIPIGRPWQALFNTTQLAVSRSNTYNTTAAAGSSKPQVAFGGGQPAEMTLDLFFDGTGVVESSETVGERIDRLLALTEYQSESHQPCFFHLYWGKFNFQGVATKVDVKYTLFGRNGEPLRATVTLALREALAPEEVSAQEGSNSPDLYQTWLVAEGDTVDAIAERIYGSPAWWRPIAEANRLANPRALVAGQVLTLPPRLD
jgi:phage tail protein X